MSRRGVERELDLDEAKNAAKRNAEEIAEAWRVLGSFGVERRGSLARGIRELHTKAVLDFGGTPRPAPRVEVVAKPPSFAFTFGTRTIPARERSSSAMVAPPTIPGGVGIPGFTHHVEVDEDALAREREALRQAYVDRYGCSEGDS